MTTLRSDVNPFMLMMDPQYVLSRIEHSERLSRLHSRICRPLDKPQLPGAQARDQETDDIELDEPAADASDRPE